MNSQCNSAISILLTTFVASVSISQSATAQSDIAPAMAPGCDYSDSALFDGFGWNNALSTSCAPVINQTLGAAVEFTRVYWDGNADIANRTLQCDLFLYDEVLRNYQPAQEIYNFISHPSYLLHHQSIPSVAPLSGWRTIRPTDETSVEIQEEIDSPRWSIEEGEYIGSGVLGSPVFELITTETGAGAVRRWVNNFTVIARLSRDSLVSFPRQGYFDCYDVSGADFAPTGSADTLITEPAALSNLEFSVTSNPAADDPGEIFNLETGDVVDLVKAHWNYNRDIAGLKGCSSAEYQGGQYSRNNSKSVDHPFHFSNSENKVFYRTSSGIEGVVSASGSYQIIDNILQYSARATNPGFAGEPRVIGNPIFTSEYIELIENGVRVWQNSEYFEECIGVKPTGSAASDGSETGDTDNPDGIDVDETDTPDIDDVTTPGSDSGGGAVGYFEFVLLLMLLSILQLPGQRRRL